MKGDFSRWTDPNAAAQGYAGVLMQQGRLHTDADWNEQVSLDARRAETALTDVIGRTGVPKDGGGFAVAPAPGGFSVSAGRFYLDGVLVENPDETTYADQKEGVTPTAIDEIVDQGAQGLVFLEVWKEHVTALEDERLQEVALGGPDTATRVQIRWRVGVMPSPAQTEAARAALIEAARKGRPLDIPEWARGTGALRAGTAEAAPSETSDCLIPPEAGYLASENQEYYVEIHRGGTRSRATFKWSREGGSVLARLGRNEDDEFVLLGDRDDEALGFVSGGWVEVFDERDRFEGRPGRLTRLTLTDGIATFAPGIGDFDQMIRPRVRRWDHGGASANGLPLSATATDLELGLQVRFEPGTYRTGDCWAIPARAATGDIEWPPVAGEDRDAPVASFCWGRRYAPLALITLGDEAVTDVVDLRADFPPLTCVEAGDVWFDDSNCRFEADTVQEALDALCAASGGICTVTVRNAEDLIAAVGRIEQGQSAHICLAGGQFQLQDTLVIDGLQHLTISGAGPQSLVTVSGAEAALLIRNCASVHLRDFSVNGGPLRNPGRMGAVTLRANGEAAVERLILGCRAGPYRMGSCLASYGSGRVGAVRVRDCRMVVGQGQVGVQIIDAARAVVENCRMAPRPVPGNVVINRLRADARLVNAIARGIVSFNPPDAAEPGAGDAVIGRAPSDVTAERAREAAREAARETAARAVNVPVRGGGTARFNAHPLAEGALTALGERLDVATESEARAMVLSIARDAVRSGGAATLAGDTFRGFAAAVATVTRQAYYAEGVAIAGARVEDAQVVGNEIRGAQHGVRLAASTSSDPLPPAWRSREPGNLVVRAVVERNRIFVEPPSATVPAHGVYAGHVRNLSVLTNEIRLPEVPGDRNVAAFWYGVRTYGYRGPLLRISGNFVSGGRFGFSVLPSLNDQLSGVWRVSENAADTPVLGQFASGVEVD